MSYLLSWSPHHARDIQTEFMALLNDPHAGADLVQLGLGLKRLAQHASSPSPGNKRAYWYVFPAGGMCSAYYTFESNNGPHMFVLGFCLTLDAFRFHAVAAGRLWAVP